MLDPTSLALLAATGGTGGVPSMPLNVTGRPATSKADARSDNQVTLSNVGNVNFAAKNDVWMWALLGAGLGALVLVAVWPKAKG